MTSNRDIYDVCSPYFLEIWGIHQHDGYYETGEESRVEAQEAMIRFLAGRARIGRGTRVLDVGCGVGGTAVWLARNLGADVTGITNSPVQASLARAVAGGEGVAARFLEADAERPTIEETFEETFEALLLLGVLGHFHDQRAFLGRARSLLDPGGRLVVADWLVREGLGREAFARDIEPLTRAMKMPEIHTLATYREWLGGSGWRLVSAEDVTDHTRRSWGLRLPELASRSLWKLVRKLGREAIPLVRGARAMKRAIVAGSLVYGVVTAERA